MIGSQWARRGVGVLVGLVVPLSAIATPALAKGKPGGGGGGGGPKTTTTFSGRATVVDATALGLNVTVSGTGALPATGGKLEESLLEVDASVGGLVSVDAEVAHAATVGMGRTSRAEASLADLSLAVDHLVRLEAGLVQSRAEATCVNGAPALKGSSEILALKASVGAGLLWLPAVNIAVTGAVNQNVALGIPGVSLVLNEQVKTANSVEVNAIHLRVDGLADVVVSHSHADITCGSKPGCDGAGDFVTGGGFITRSSGKANFAVAGGMDKGGRLWWGHLQYKDHNGVKVQGTAVTSYSAVGTTTTRVITGEAEINGSGGHTFRATVTDNGEPGRGSDTFVLELDGGAYSAGGTLRGGNIQLHKPNGCR